MSTTRHSKIRSLSAKYSPGHRIDWHVHDWSQLIYANEGVMTVETEVNRWVVPRRRAIWVPAGKRHRIEMHGAVYLRTIYTQSCAHLQRSLEVVGISPLLHELIQHVCDRGIVAGSNADDKALIAFLISQLQKLESVPLVVAMPSDPRARRFAQSLIREPSCQTGLAETARQAGSSLRTLQRIFSKELGVSISTWRNQVRMLSAIELLEREESVTRIALALGFESMSAFIHAFKQCYGMSPGKYRKRE